LVVRGPLSVTFHGPIHPAGRGWAETLRLREEAMGCINQAMTSRGTAGVTAPAESA
jgi:hypothetical protein